MRGIGLVFLLVAACPTTPPPIEGEGDAGEGEGDEGEGDEGEGEGEGDVFGGVQGDFCPDLNQVCRDGSVCTFDLEFGQHCLTACEARCPANEPCQDGLCPGDIACAAETCPDGTICQSFARGHFCGPPRQRDESCNIDNCDDGLVCASFEPRTCQPRCTAARCNGVSVRCEQNSDCSNIGAGDVCQPPEPGDPRCSNDEVCADDGFGHDACVAAIPLGATCNRVTQGACATGSVCAFRSDDETVCAVDCGTGDPVCDDDGTTPCNEDGDCATGACGLQPDPAVDCGSDAVCQTTATPDVFALACLPERGRNASCLLESGDSGCAGELVCTADGFFDDARCMERCDRRVGSDDDDATCSVGGVCLTNENLGEDEGVACDVDACAADAAACPCDATRGFACRFDRCTRLGGECADAVPLSVPADIDFGDVTCEPARGRRCDDRIFEGVVDNPVVVNCRNTRLQFNDFDNNADEGVCIAVCSFRNGSQFPEFQRNCGPGYHCDRAVGFATAQGLVEGDCDVAAPGCGPQEPCPACTFLGAGASCFPFSGGDRCFLPAGGCVADIP